MYNFANEISSETITQLFSLETCMHILAEILKFNGTLL